MKKINFFKRNIKLFIGIIIGGVIFGGGTYVVATTIASSEITYTGNAPCMYCSLSSDNSVECCKCTDYYQQNCTCYN